MKGKKEKKKRLGEEEVEVEEEKKASSLSSSEDYSSRFTPRGKSKTSSLAPSRLFQASRGDQTRSPVWIRAVCAGGKGPHEEKRRREKVGGTFANAPRSLFSFIPFFFFVFPPFLSPPSLPPSRIQPRGETSKGQTPGPRD